MSYQALARKYRPQTFEDVIGQETAVRTLHNAIEDSRIHHAYLFSGVRGIGKTTTARILAKALNCIKGPTSQPDNTCTMCREITEGIDMDVREIDAATYTGVDNVRELRDVSQFQPARDRYRIFIIDEAHMLSSASWNALLKLIEEPPPHVIFMFATTEMHKVPATILSRVQKFILRKITLDDLIAQLEKICKAEGIKAERAALEIVARRGEGSVRDSLSLLDQIIAFSGRSISVADVATILGLSETSFFARVITLVAEGDHGALLEALQEAADSGRDFKMLYRDLLNFVRNLLLLAGNANEALLAVAPEDLAMLRAAAEQFSYTDLLRIANLLLRDDETVNRAEHQRLAVEIALLKAATFPRLKSVESVIASGAGSITTTSAPTPARPAPRLTDNRQPTTDNASASSLVAKVKQKRPLIGGYLESARMEREGNRITFIFEDAFHADSVSDAKDAIAAIASEMTGEKITIETKVAAAEETPTGRRSEDKPVPLRDDPVLSSFRKHLGGELVKEKR
ncbi:MAG TPA: DNA polymerase III subunit gamma/tau [Thermoanaerobaculia bacterium]|jgi:DNA polymerase-3 subunit gamma/tau|nr:DNA polymerase III subunit gamma/tau [Thermoanaerobaculia bacterium]